MHSAETTKRTTKTTASNFGSMLRQMESKSVQKKNFSLCKSAILIACICVVCAIWAVIESQWSSTPWSPISMFRRSCADCESFLVAHRGLHDPDYKTEQRPIENSIDADRDAWREKGFNLVETDVHAVLLGREADPKNSASYVLMAVHDSTMLRVAESAQEPLTDLDPHLELVLKTFNDVFEFPIALCIGHVSSWSPDCHKDICTAVEAMENPDFNLAMCLNNLEHITQQLSTDKSPDDPTFYEYLLAHLPITHMTITEVQSVLLKGGAIVPTLAQVLGEIDIAQQRLIVEIKDSHPDTTMISQLYFRMAKETPKLMKRVAVVMSFSVEIMCFFGSNKENYNVDVLSMVLTCAQGERSREVKVPFTLEGIQSFVGNLHSYDSCPKEHINGLYMEYEKLMMDASSQNVVKDAGMKFGVWGVKPDDLTTLEELHANGFSFVNTDLQSPR